MRRDFDLIAIALGVVGLIPGLVTIAAKWIGH